MQDKNKGEVKPKPPVLDKATLIKRIQENHRRTQLQVNQLQNKLLAKDRG